jgi:type II secretory pathway component PulC
MIFSLTGNWKYFFEKKEKTPVLITVPATTRNASPAKQEKTQEKTADEQPSGEEADYQQMLALARGRNWGPDPFGISDSTAAEQDKQNQEQGRGDIRLESILLTPSQSLAVINNQLLTEGDVFQGRRIYKITKDSVVMEMNGVLQELKMKDYGIPTVYIKTPVAGPAEATDGK